MIKKKNIKKQNYFILFGIYLAVIIGVMYLASWYTTYKKYQENIPVLQDVVMEISPSELEHYLTENLEGILYFCSVSDRECRDFENSIKGNLKSSDINNLIYVNLDGIQDKKQYVNDLLNKFDFSADRIPCFVKYADGKVTAVSDGLNGSVLTKAEALKFLGITK